MVSGLETENNSLKTELVILQKRFDAKVDALNLRVKKLEKEKQDLFEEKLVVEERLENIIREGIGQDERNYYKKHAEEGQLQIKNLTLRNEELVQRVETLRRLNQDKDISFQTKIEDSMKENRRAYEEKITSVRREVTDHANDKLKKYKANLEAMQAENEALKQEIKNRPNIRRFRTRSQDGETSPDHVLEQTEIYRSSEVNLAKRILKDIIKILNV